MSASPLKTFCKTERLQHSYQFRAVYEKGRRYHSALFTFFVTKNSTPLSRLGITVTKKVGNAVQRNRCKRILREIFRLNKHQLVTPFDLVFNVKKSMLTTPYLSIEKEFLRLLACLPKP